MALILKPGKTFTSPQTGVTVSNPYMRIGICNYDRDNLKLTLYVNTYSSLTSFQQNLSPIYSIKVDILGAAFTASFVPTNSINSVFTNAYSYLLSLPNGDIVWSDWQSDGVTN